MRTMRWLPTTAVFLTPAARGLIVASARRADRWTTTRNATAAHTWAATVPHAEPAMPVSNP